MYLVLDDGVPLNLVLVTHVFQKTDQLDEKQIEIIPRMLDALQDAAPAARIRDLLHSCDVSLRYQGDYLGTLLRCATASEVLVKECAWMLLWESEFSAQEGADPTEGSRRGIHERRVAGEALRLVDRHRVAVGDVALVDVP